LVPDTKLDGKFKEIGPQMRIFFVEEPSLKFSLRNRKLEEFDSFAAAVDVAAVDVAVSC